MNMAQETPLGPSHSEYILPFPPCPIAITLKDHQLVRLRYAPGETLSPATQLPIVTAVMDWLAAYWRSPETPCHLPHTLAGTPFQQSVWRALQRIPVGDVWTYSELAAALGSHPRAIGSACRRNPLPLLYPCHRIVAKGDLGGFCGETSGIFLTIKQQLLIHEQAITPP